MLFLGYGRYVQVQEILSTWFPSLCKAGVLVLGRFWCFFYLVWMLGYAV